MKVENVGKSIIVAILSDTDYGHALLPRVNQKICALRFDQHADCYCDDVIVVIVTSFAFTIYIHRDIRYIIVPQSFMHEFVSYRIFYSFVLYVGGYMYVDANSHWRHERHISMLRCTIQKEYFHASEVLVRYLFFLFSKQNSTFYKQLGLRRAERSQKFGESVKVGASEPSIRAISGISNYSNLNETRPGQIIGNLYP